MRDARRIFTVFAVASALSAVGLGARSYRAMTTRSLELERRNVVLERQNVALIGGYDELRAGYIECLGREEEQVIAATHAALDADPRVTREAGHRGRDAASRGMR